VVVQPLRPEPYWGLGVGAVGPAVARGNDHADTRNGHDVAALRELGMCLRGRGLGDAEALCERDPARDGVAWGVGARADLALDNPRDLEIARHTAQVIKIIRHLTSLDSLVRLAR